MTIEENLRRTTGKFGEYSGKFEKNFWKVQVDIRRNLGGTSAKLGKFDKTFA